MHDVNSGSRVGEQEIGRLHISINRDWTALWRDIGVHDTFAQAGRDGLLERGTHAWLVGRRPFD